MVAVYIDSHGGGAMLHKSESIGVALPAAPTDKCKLDAIKDHMVTCVHVCVAVCRPRFANGPLILVLDVGSSSNNPCDANDVDDNSVVNNANDDVHATTYDNGDITIGNANNHNHKHNHFINNNNNHGNANDHDNENDGKHANEDIF